MIVSGAEFHDKRYFLVQAPWLTGSCSRRSYGRVLLGQWGHCQFADFEHFDVAAVILRHPRIDAPDHAVASVIDVGPAGVPHHHATDAQRCADCGEGRAIRVDIAVAELAVPHGLVDIFVRIRPQLASGELAPAGVHVVDVCRR